MNKRTGSKLWLHFTLVAFASIVTIFLLIAGSWLLLIRLQIITPLTRMRHIPMVFFLMGSLLSGGTIAVYVARNIIRPIQNISNAFGELSRGNFDVRVPEDARLDEIQEMAQRFNSMAYDLSHIETLRNDFVADVSHEFKTPISAIEGYATLLQDTSLSPGRHERYVGKILDNSRKLSNLSSNILLLSKLENQETVLHRQEYRLDEQIRRSVLALEDKWAAREIEPKISLPKLTYYGNEELLEHVWSNLLDNAIRHSPDRGCIRIWARLDGQTISIYISDEGSGMSEEVQKHIFEKFYRGDRSRSGEGNGLGLALVRRITELCDGSVTVKSAPGRGSVFTVSLPPGE